MQRNYKSVPRESAFTSQKELSDEPFSTGTSLFNIMETKEIPLTTQYLITSTGRIFSKNYHREGYMAELKPYIDKRGYERIAISINRKTKFFLVHRLVAITFIPNPLNLPYINHINSNPADNRVENLEWCDQKYNLIHAHTFNKLNINMSKGENHRDHKLTEIEVLQIRKLYKPKIYGCLILAKKFNITYQSVLDILHRVTWKHI
jgi:hypothetical protein